MLFSLNDQDGWAQLNSRIERKRIQQIEAQRKIELIEEDERKWEIEHRQKIEIFEQTIARLKLAGIKPNFDFLKVRIIYAPNTQTFSK